MTKLISQRMCARLVNIFQAVNIYGKLHEDNDFFVVDLVEARNKKTDLILEKSDLPSNSRMSLRRKVKKLDSDFVSGGELSSDKNVGKQGKKRSRSPGIP